MNINITTNTSQWSSCQSIDRDTAFLDSTLFDKDDSCVRNQTSIRSISLGKLSLIILILATLADQALVQVYHSSSSTNSSSSQRFSLGSAAISTVTEKLSPILPFAGGMDIRRGDYWKSGSWVDSVRSITADVKVAYQRKQQQQTPSPSKKLTTMKLKTSRKITLSNSTPFASIDSIGQLTLADIGEIFRWSAGKMNHRRNAGASKMILSAARAIDSSIGSDYGSVTAGELDALKFVAAMRIFAEWRMVRQVPEGYKGFAVGMSLGHKDVVQNLVKMEESIHRWLDDHPYSLTPPTLRQLLTWEIATGVNPMSNLPRLKEKSAGIGLLWVRRQLAYQTKIFDNVLHSQRFPSMKDAVSDAYKAVYDKYHGWAVQKLFNYSFQAAPDATEILLHMNAHKRKEVLASAPDQNTFQSTTTTTVHENRNPIEAFFFKIGEECDKFRRFVGDGWDKVRGAKPMKVSFVSAADDYVTRVLVNDAHVQIAAYLEAAQPVLDNLANLFDELNMDDPSRV